MKYLLISPDMFDYTRDMIEFLENKNNNVIWYNDSILFNLFNKLKGKVKKKYLFNKFDKYWDKIIEDNRNQKFDFTVLIFGGEMIQKKHIVKLLSSHKEAKSIYYNWDSSVNFPNVLDFYKCFDRYLSFDKLDCEKYGFEFRPLYYSNLELDYKPIFDYCSIMTYGWKKSNHYRKIQSILPHGMNGKEYLYVRSKKSLFFNKILHYSAYKNIPSSNLKFKPLNKQETNELMAKSKAVIDCPLDNQNGLTIRTFETLHLKRKLITTNKSIKNYDFYTPNNIFIVDDDENLDDSFFNTKFDDDYSLNEYYSFDSFMKDVFEL